MSNTTQDNPDYCAACKRPALTCNCLGTRSPAAPQHNPAFVTTVNQAGQDKQVVQKSVGQFDNTRCQVCEQFHVNMPCPRMVVQDLPYVVPCAVCHGNHLTEVCPKRFQAYKAPSEHYQVADIKTANSSGVKADAGKLPMELLPFLALDEVAAVLQFGAKKYAAHNWRKGLHWSRLLGAAIRHLFLWGAGQQDTDAETGLSHLAHAACCVLFLLEYEKTGGGTDDRWKGNTDAS